MLEKQNVNALYVAHNSRPEELAVFTERQRDRYLRHFRSELVQVTGQILEYLACEISKLESEMELGIKTSCKPKALGRFLMISPIRREQNELMTLVQQLFVETSGSLTRLCDRLFEEYRNDLHKAYPNINSTRSVPKLTNLKLPPSKTQLTRDYKLAAQPLQQLGRSVGTSFLANIFKGSQICQLQIAARSCTKTCLLDLKTGWEKALETFTARLGNHFDSELFRLAAFYNKTASSQVAKIQVQHLNAENSLEVSLRAVRVDLDWVRREVGK